MLWCCDSWLNEFICSFSNSYTSPRFVFSSDLCLFFYSRRIRRHMVVEEKENCENVYFQHTSHFHTFYFIFSSLSLFTGWARLVSSCLSTCSLNFETIPRNETLMSEWQLLFFVLVVHCLHSRQYRTESWCLSAITIVCVS